MTGKLPTLTADSPFGLSELVRVARERRSVILKVAAGAMTAVALALLLLPARYTASSVVMLETRKNNVTDLSSVLSQTPTDPASLQNQIQILRSRGLAEKVIGKLGLATDPEFEPSGGLFGVTDARRMRDATIDKFLDRLTVDAVGLSTSLNVSFASRDPEKAARIVDAIANAYVAEQVNAKFEATTKTTQWLMDRIQRLAAQVQASEEAVQRYKAEHNLNDTAGDSIVDQQMGAISAQLVSARAELAQKQATYARVMQLVKAGRAADVSQVVASPLIAQLRAQESDLIQQEAELSTRYGPKHPKMIEIESQKRNLDAKIAQEVRRVVETAANDMAVSQAQVASLEGSLRGAEHESADDNLARVKLKSLEANAASTENMYQAFVARLRATQDSTADQMPDARVISRAAIPEYPDGPRKAFVIAASIPTGLLLGLLVALVMERMDAGGIARSSFPVMARIPLSQRRLADVVVDFPASSPARAINALAGALLPMGASGRAVLIAPIARGEHQTDLAIGLARAAAQNGRRVVLIDGNFRNPRLAHAIGVINQRGLVAALTGRLRLSQCFFRDTRSGAFMLACSQGLHNPAQILGSPAMAQLVAHLRTACDLVMIDCGPIMESNDAAQLARLCDVALVVAQDTPKNTLQQAVAELAGTAPQVAIVSVDMARAA
ncbi:MAG TPA: polysaccharide biosynthesis tyrosine autokinase [Rhizomicrobium sp.]|nr:polysaccharide biosynthesis tyrosine autokinase [Rhizomicrobium sp.]